ncbi:MAG: PSD1 domain-containing protein [Akkermansiaceae bacterium]|nr:PSD1 domain-containing protein [Akkermansiaceae bacterium]
MRRIAFAITFLAFGASTAAQAADASDDIAFFESKIRPLLVSRCYQCHSKGEKMKGELLLDSRNGWMIGGTLGPAIVPGDLDKSLLVEAVRYRDEDLAMPPKGRLPDHEIALLEEWVRRGAPDPRIDESVKAKEGIDIEAGRQFWSFRPIEKSAPPAVKNADWPRRDSDRFVLAKLEDNRLAPAADADPATLLRRLSYDLTGLPPASDRVESFVAAFAEHPDPAVAAEVDHLLASEAFGEKWGRHWLDLARYGDSNGSSFNVVTRSAWRYRNWVIEAMNANLPIDQFIRMQIAGDLLPWETQEERDDNLIAAAYLMIGSKVLGLFDKDQLQMDVVDEQIELVGKGLLGLTLGCARCHDHKFDPVPTADYYALAGIFTSTRTLNGRIKGPLEDESDVMIRGLGPGGDELLRAFLEKHRHDWEKSEDKLYGLRPQVARLEREAGENPGDAKLAAELEKKRAELAKYEAMWRSFPELPAWVYSPMDEAEPADTTIRVRGGPTAHGDVVPRGFLQVASWDGQPLVNPEQSGRLELAEWLVAPENPLTARVFVNRVWQKLFGEGIVRSVDNFGVRGETPTHPELLDFLASDFVGNGWDLKALIRDLATSRAYRMAATVESGPTEPGIENRLLQHQNRRRLEPEEIRDTLLLLSGRLERGPRGAVVDHLPLTEVNDGLEDKGVVETNHRTVYQPVIRNTVMDVMEIFDFPNPAMPTGQRARTTVAPQALYLMNSPFVQETTAELGHRLMDPWAGSTPEAVLETIFEQVICRPPTTAEMNVLMPYFEKQFEGDPMPSPHDRAKMAQALVASTLFQYLD